MDIYRNQWIEQTRDDLLSTWPPAPRLPDELSEAEISSVRACLEAMPRHYNVPMVSVCYYLQEDAKTVQAWKRGLAPPTRKALNMLRSLVAKLDQARKNDRG